MAKLDVIQKVDGNLVIKSTWVDNPTGAKKAFHDVCSVLYGDKDTTSGVVAILDDNLDVFEGNKVFIIKEA